MYGDFYEDLSAIFDPEQATEDEIKNIVVKMGLDQMDVRRRTIVRRQWISYLISQLPKKPSPKDGKRDILLVLLGLVGMTNPIPVGVRSVKVEVDATSASDEMLVLTAELLIKKAVEERQTDLEKMEVLDVVNDAYRKLEELLNRSKS